MTKINEVLNKETLQDVQEVFANAIEDIKATFEGAVVEAYQKGVTHGMTLGMSVEHTKPKYKTEKRKAEIGERFIVTEPHCTFEKYEKGDVFTVLEFFGDGVIAKELREKLGESDEPYIRHGEYEVIVEEPEQAPVKELTPNEQRAALIEKARGFVEEKKTLYGGLTSRKGYDAPSGSNAVTDADFIVNIEKRAVVCLLRTQLGKQVVDKGIEKCHPNEVFNADIGKAIALARALEIDVPKEFLNAVQPDELVKGQYVELLEKTGELHVKGEITEVIAEDIVSFSEEDYLDCLGWVYTQTTLIGLNSKIINDTNAIYEVEK